jgi:molybdate transport system substrate-binding protein
LAAHPLQLLRDWRAAGRSVAVLLGLSLFVSLPSQAAPSAAPVRVAVAANFLATARELALAFEAGGSGRVEFVAGSTGMLLAQISEGAPFDVLLAADRVSVRRLAALGKIEGGSNFTYATGRLVLWSADPALVDDRGDVLRTGSFSHIAVANAALAPYGKAAEQTLLALGLRERLGPRLVTGASVGQAFEFVASGNAELGFVAYSQLGREGARRPGSAWIVPENLYEPLLQDAALLAGAASPQAAREWLAFLKGEKARTIIAAWGYYLPPARP